MVQFVHMKQVLGMFFRVVSAGVSQGPKRLQAQTSSEDVRVCPLNVSVSEYQADYRRLTSEFLPVLTK
jgi:hypothetical protein